MDCNEARELISARIDGELELAEQVALDLHLKICERCRRALTAESQLKQHTRPPAERSRRRTPAHAIQAR